MGRPPALDSHAAVADRDLHLMSHEQFEQAADFIDAAVAARARALKRRRARMGLTQSDLSKALGVALTTVGRWEIGQRRIPEMAVRLIDRLQRENRKREVREPRRG